MQWSWWGVVLVCLLVVGQARAVAPAWYLLVDDVKTNAARLDAFPLYKQFDWTTTAQKPTVLAAVPITVPISLQSCTDVAIDLPLRRDIPAYPLTPAAPTMLSVFQWRNRTPFGQWALANAQVSEMWTIASAPLTNSTWQPDRAIGVYRFQHAFTTPVGGGTTTYFGFYFDQPGTVVDGNAIYWIAGGSLPLRYIDIYGNFGPGRTDFQAAPDGTDRYTYGGQNISTVTATVYFKCTPLLGGQQPPVSFVTMPEPSWDTAMAPVLPPTPTPLVTPPTAVPATPTPTGTLQPPTPPPPSPSSGIVVNAGTPSASLINFIPDLVPTPPPPPPSTGVASPAPPESVINLASQGGMIAAIVLGSLIGVAMVIVVAVLVVRRYKRLRGERLFVSMHRAAADGGGDDTSGTDSKAIELTPFVALEEATRGLDPDKTAVALDPEAVLEASESGMQEISADDDNNDDAAEKKSDSESLRSQRMRLGLAQPVDLMPRATDDKK